MIRIEAAEDHYRVTADSLSASAAVDLDREATRTAADRYLADLDRLYETPVTDGLAFDPWLLHPVATRDDRYWPAFRAYVALAKLRLLFESDRGPVRRECSLPRDVDRAVADFCDEFGVRYERPAHHDPDTGASVLRRLVRAGHSTARAVTTTVAVLAFLLLQPLVRRVLDRTRDDVDVRFWLHPVYPLEGRFFDAPTALRERGHSVGYAVFGRAHVAGLGATLRGAVRAGRRLGDDTAPVPVEWYLPPVSAGRAYAEGLRIAGRMRHRARELRTDGTTPELGSLLRRITETPRSTIAERIVVARAFDAFATAANDDVWVRAQDVTSGTSRFSGIVGDRHDITVVAMAPHYYSQTRLSNRFSAHERDPPRARALPDRFAVAEPLSATTLREDGIAADRVAVVADKANAELRVAAPSEVAEPQPAQPDGDRGDDAPTAGAGPLSVLVVLQTASENERLVAAVERAGAVLEDVEFRFKPHPFFPPDGILDGISGVEYEVASAQASLADLVDAADVCLSVYSTATFPALATGVPVVWAPFCGENHVFVDLLDQVGIRADDADELASALERLATDPSHYADESRACRAFARERLLPETEQTLADVVESMLERADRSA